MIASCSCSGYSSVATVGLDQSVGIDPTSPLCTYLLLGTGTDCCSAARVYQVWEKQEPAGPWLNVHMHRSALAESWP